MNVLFYVLFYVSLSLSLFWLARTIIGYVRFCLKDLSLQAQDHLAISVELIANVLLAVAPSLIYFLLK